MCFSNLCMACHVLFFLLSARKLFDLPPTCTRAVKKIGIFQQAAQNLCSSFWVCWCLMESPHTFECQNHPKSQHHMHSDLNNQYGGTFQNFKKAICEETEQVSEYAKMPPTLVWKPPANDNYTSLGIHDRSWHCRRICTTPGPSIFQEKLTIQRTLRGKKPPVWLLKCNQTSSETQWPWCCLKHDPQRSNLTNLRLKNHTKATSTLGLTTCKT